MKSVAMRLQKILISIAIISVLVIAFSVVASSVFKPNQATPIKNVLPAAASNTKLPSGFTIAAWIWRYPTELDGRATELIDFAQAEGINTLYLYIDEYIDIYEMSEGPVKQGRLADYTKAVKNIIGQAALKNMTVHALSGNPNYGYDSHSYIPPILMEHVYEFNKDNPDTQFTGIQFDIEFYEDARFYGSTEEYTQYYLSLVEQLADKSKELNQKYNQNLRFGMVVPFWFDKPNEYFTKPILPEILNSLKDLSNSYLVVMAYRNVIEGDGSVMEVSRDELELADSSPVKIIIAQELNENREKQITHFGKSREEIKADLAKIVELAKTHPSFEGLSIHELETFAETR